MPHAPDDAPPPRRRRQTRTTPPPPARTISHPPSRGSGHTPAGAPAGYPGQHTYGGRVDRSRITHVTDSNDAILAYGLGPLNLPAGKLDLPSRLGEHQQPPPPLIPPIIQPAFGEHQGVAGGTAAGATTGGLPSPSDVGGALAGALLDRAREFTHPVGFVQHRVNESAWLSPPFIPEIRALQDAIGGNGQPPPTPPPETLPLDVQARLAFDREMILDARRRYLDHLGQGPLPLQPPGGGSNIQLPGAETLPKHERDWISRILTGAPQTEPKPKRQRPAPGGVGRQAATPRPRAPKPQFDPNRVAAGAQFLQQQGIDLGVVDPRAKRALTGVLLHFAFNEPDRLRGMLPGFAQTNILDPGAKAWLLSLAHHYHVDVKPNENEAQLVLDVTTAIKGHPSYASSLASHVPQSIANIAIGTPAFLFSAGAATQDLARGDTTSSQQLLKGLAGYYGNILRDPAEALRTDPAGTVLAVAPAAHVGGEIAGRRGFGLRPGEETIQGPPSTRVDIPGVAPHEAGAPATEPRTRIQELTRRRSTNALTRPLQVAADFASRGPRRDAEGEPAARSRIARAAGRRLPGGITYKGKPVLWDLRVQRPGRRLAAQRAARSDAILASAMRHLIQLEPDAALTRLAHYNDTLFRLDPRDVLRFFEEQYRSIERTNRTRGVGEPRSTFENRRDVTQEKLDQIAQQIDHYRAYVKLADQVRGDPDSFEAYRQYGVELERQITNQEVLLGRQMGWTPYQRIARAYMPRALVEASNLESDIEGGMRPAPGGGPTPGPTPPEGVPNPVAADQRPAAGPARVTELPVAEETLTPQEAQARADEAAQQAEIQARRANVTQPPPAEQPATPKRGRRAKPKRQSMMPQGRAETFVDEMTLGASSRILQHLDQRAAEKKRKLAEPRHSFQEPVTLDGTDFVNEHAANQYLARKYGKDPAGGSRVSVPHVSHTGKDWMVSNWEHGATGGFKSRAEAMAHRQRLLDEGPPKPQAAPEPPKPAPPAEKPREAPAAPERPAQPREPLPERPRPATPVQTPESMAEAVTPKPEEARIAREPTKPPLRRGQKPAEKPAPSTYEQTIRHHTERLKPHVDELEAFLRDPREIERAGEYLRTEHHRKGGMHSSSYARRQVHQHLENLLGKGPYTGIDALMKRGQRNLTAGQWAARIKAAAERQLAETKRVPKSIADREARTAEYAAERERKDAEEKQRLAEVSGKLTNDRPTLVWRWDELRTQLQRERGTTWATAELAQKAKVRRDAIELEQRAIEQKLGIGPSEIEQVVARQIGEKIQLPHGEATVYRGATPEAQARQAKLAAELRARSEKPVKPRTRYLPRAGKMRAIEPPHELAQRAFNALTDARVAIDAGNTGALADVVDALAEMLGTNPGAVRSLLGHQRLGELTPTEVEKVIGEKTPKVGTQTPAISGYIPSPGAIHDVLKEGGTPSPEQRVGYVVGTGRVAPRTLEEWNAQHPPIKGGSEPPDEPPEEPPYGAEAGWRDSFYPDQPRVPPELDPAPPELVAAAQAREDGRPSIWSPHQDDPRWISFTWLRHEEAYRHALFEEGKSPESAAMVALDNKRNLALAAMRAHAAGGLPKDYLVRRTVKGRVRYSPAPRTPGEPAYVPLVRSRHADLVQAGGAEGPVTTDAARLIGGRGRAFKGQRILGGDFEHAPEATYGAIAQTYRVHHYTALVRGMVAQQGVTAEPGTWFDPRRWVLLNVGEKAPRGLSKISGGRRLAPLVETNQGLRDAIADFEDRTLDLERHDRQPDEASLEKVRVIYHQRNPYAPAMHGSRYAEMPEGDFVLLPRPVHDLLVREARGSTLRHGSFVRNLQSATRTWRSATLYARPAWLVFNAVGNQGNVMLAGATGETLRAVGRATANVAFKGLGRPAKRGAAVPPGVDFQGFVAAHTPRLGREGSITAGDFGIRHAMKRFADVHSMRDLFDPARWPGTAADAVRIYTTALRDANVAIENAQRRTIARAEMRRMAKRDLGGDAKLWLRKLAGDWKGVQADLARHMEAMAYDQRAADHVLGTVQDFLGNFAHGIPRPYLDLAVPFWRWTAFVTRLAFWTLPVRYPGRASLLATASNLGAQASMQQGDVPERLAGAIPIAGPAANRLVAKVVSVWPLATITSIFYAEPGSAPGASGILGGANPYLKAAWQAAVGTNFPTGDLYTQKGDRLATDVNPVDRARGLVNALERSVPVVSALEGRGLASTNTILDTLGQAAGVPGMREQIDPRSFSQSGRQPTYSGLLRIANYMGLPLERADYESYNQKRIKALAASVTTELNTRAKRETRNMTPAQQLAWWKKHTPPESTVTYWKYLVSHPDRLAYLITHGAQN